MRLPDDFWDGVEDEGGWPGFLVAFLVFAALLIVIPAYIWLAS